MPSPVTVYDVGNSALKAVAFDGGGRIVDAARILLRDTPPVLPPRSPGPVVAVSVSDRHRALLEEALGEPLLLVGRDLPLPFADRSRAGSGTGADRLAAARAAAVRAGGAAAVLGAGTAVTADAVSGDGTFLGGAIAPGLRAGAAGLAAAAPGLPPVLLEGASSAFPGRDTAAALAAGHLLGFAGMLDRLAEEAAAAAGEGRGAGIPVFLHGGDAERMLPLLRTAVVPAPHLVAEGARLAWIEAGG